MGRGSAASRLPEDANRNSVTLTRDRKAVIEIFIGREWEDREALGRLHAEAGFVESINQEATTNIDG